MKQEQAHAGWHDESSWGEEMETREHLQTYEGFLSGAKYGSIAVAIVLILMAMTLL
ncbi:aa3-type cytochrome c oxidase subunit IV [Tepidicaulis sp. LMO-SS28]|uniref:aa3-type cytochrome c oxidase subunit IV n=1 Tax=Tepidicaulis sp. LMO-SS28 TaxID=3447455 RepID=UPI003EE04645